MEINKGCLGESELCITVVIDWLTSGVRKEKKEQAEKKHLTPWPPPKKGGGAKKMKIK